MFDLQENYSAKEPHAAYRRLARVTHPDKNGRTEEAKDGFQTMRARYEELKEQFQQVDPSHTERSPEAAGEKDPEAPDEVEAADEESIFHCLSSDHAVLRDFVQQIVKKPTRISTCLSDQKRELRNSCREPYKTAFL